MRDTEPRDVEGRAAFLMRVCAMNSPAREDAFTTEAIETGGTVDLSGRSLVDLHNLRIQVVKKTIEDTFTYWILAAVRSLSDSETLEWATTTIRAAAAPDHEIVAACQAILRHSDEAAWKSAAAETLARIESRAA